jgi:hypothetical protein
MQETNPYQGPTSPLSLQKTGETRGDGWYRFSGFAIALLLPFLAFSSTSVTERLHAPALIVQASFGLWIVSIPVTAWGIDRMLWSRDNPPFSHFVRATTSMIMTYYWLKAIVSLTMKIL